MNVDLNGDDNDDGDGGISLHRIWDKIVITST